MERREQRNIIKKMVFLIVCLGLVMPNFVLASGPPPPPPPPPGREITLKLMMPHFAMDEEDVSDQALGDIFKKIKKEIDFLKKLKATDKLAEQYSDKLTELKGLNKNLLDQTFSALKKGNQKMILELVNKIKKGTYITEPKTATESKKKKVEKKDEDTPMEKHIMEVRNAIDKITNLESLEAAMKLYEKKGVTDKGSEWMQAKRSILNSLLSKITGQVKEMKANQILAVEKKAKGLSPDDTSEENIKGWMYVKNKMDQFKRDDNVLIYTRALDKEVRKRLRKTTAISKKLQTYIETESKKREQKEKERKERLKFLTNLTSDITSLEKEIKKRVEKKKQFDPEELIKKQISMSAIPKNLKQLEAGNQIFATKMFFQETKEELENCLEKMKQIYEKKAQLEILPEDEREEKENEFLKNYQGYITQVKDIMKLVPAVYTGVTVVVPDNLAETITQKVKEKELALMQTDLENATKTEKPSENSQPPKGGGFELG